MRVSTQSGFRYPTFASSGSSAFTAVAMPSPAFGLTPARLSLPWTVGVGHSHSSYTAFTRD